MIEINFEKDPLKILQMNKFSTQKWPESVVWPNWSNPFGFRSHYSLTWGSKAFRWTSKLEFEINEIGNNEIANIFGHLHNKLIQEKSIFNCNLCGSYIHAEWIVCVISFYFLFQRIPQIYPNRIHLKKISSTRSECDEYSWNKTFKHMV